MKAEAIQQLEQFKSQLNSSQVETVSISEAKPKRAINYPKHIKSLKDRILSALANGCRTPDSVATYCGEDIKLITMQLGRWVSRGMIGKHTNVVSGITRYYPHDIAKEKGFLTKPQPINRGKKAKLKTENRSSSFVMPKSLEKADEALAAKQMNLFKDIPAPIRAKEEQYILFLERRIIEWQAECRKLASEAKKYANQISELEQEVIKAKTEPRNVTGEVAEVMEEVTKLRATIAYLESKLFGSK
jgi:hypothetical protein